MSVLTTVTTSTRTIIARPPALSASKVGSEGLLEVIMSSKTREERRTLETGRRASVVQSEDAERFKERRGSKDSSRRKSVVTDNTSEQSKHRGATDRRKEVLVIKG